jgi:hypothetical protein
MWHIWPGRLWPADAKSEAALVAGLRALVKRPSRATRDDVTALLSILRCGTTLEEAMAFAPGLRPAGLLAAHQKLDQLRRASAAAWDAIAADPTVPIWRANVKAASRIYPVAVDRVRAALEIDPRRLETSVHQIQQRMDEMSAIALEIERRCAATPSTLPQAGALSALLFNPHGTHAYADPFFVPTRVAVLSPTRVGDLLGERQG